MGTTTLRSHGRAATENGDSLLESRTRNTRSFQILPLPHSSLITQTVNFMQPENG